MGSNVMELVLFDFDYIVIICDIYGCFLCCVVIVEQLVQVWWKVGLWLVVYRLKLILVECICVCVICLIFSDCYSDDIVMLVVGFLCEFLFDVVCLEMLEQICWYKEQQYIVVIVFGLLDLYLWLWCEQLGLQLICNWLESQDGCLIGCYVGGDCGLCKVEYICCQFDLLCYVCIYVYGDSFEDKLMLVLVYECWFRGKFLK